jgi:hypothetical protein
VAAPSASSRSALLPFAAAAGTIAILVTYDAHFPVRQWLVWRIAGYWLLTLYFGAGCAALGTLVVERLAPRQYRPAEALILGFAVGVVAFSALVLVVGLVGGLGKAFFVLAPGALVAAGHRSLFRTCKRLLDRFRAHPPKLSLLETAALVLGVAGLLAVYVPILTPHNVQHDARWYHLPVAQQFASTGTVARFPEGWLLGAYPHLASFLYTWAFLLPAGVVHRIILAGHVEFLVFLVTIAAIPGLVRRFSPGTRLPLAWAALFLFPGFLRYDSNLSTGADHIAALFASAGMIALLPALRTLSVRHAVLVGITAAGALSTKYSAISIAGPLVGFVLVRAVLHANTTGKNVKGLVASVAVVGAFLVAWAPHWLPNLVWYGDPLYPMLRGHFSPHPWDAEADMYFRVFMDYAILKPTHDLSGILETLIAATTLGFRSYETGFHGETPIFGFLFAATLFCLPFTRLAPRVRLAYALAFTAVSLWYFTNHRDRYLQACLPWLVVATVVVLEEMWHSSRAPVRVSAAVLVLAQLACGAGAYLEPSHFMIPGYHPLVQVMAMVGQGHKGEYAQRFEPYKEWHFAAWTELGRRLPPDARVLVHEDRLWVGLDRPVVVDEAQWQAGIRYGGLTTTGQVYDVLKRYGVTHVVTGEPHSDGGDHGLAGNIVFWEFLTSSAKRITSLDGLDLWAMPASRPVEKPMGDALVLTCNQSLSSGLYRFTGIRERATQVEVPPKSRAPRALLDRATFVVIEDECGSSADPEGLAAFATMTKRAHVTYYRRRPLSDAP